MIASDSLFLLIRSLNKNEKRHIRLTASKYSNSANSACLKLFDEMERQKKFDERLLKERNPKQAFVKRLAVEKHNLYKMILRSLTGYYREKPVEIQLKEMIMHAQILFQKNLFRDYEKLLLKAKKLAYRYEKWMPLLEIITMQRKLTRDGIVAVPLSKWMEEEEVVLKKLSIEYTFRKLNSQASDIIKKSVVRGKEQFRQLKEIQDHSLFRSEETNFSFASKRYKYNTLMIINRSLGKEEENYRFAVRSEEVFTQFPQFREANPDTYLSSLINRIIAEAEYHKLPEAFNSLEKLKTLAIVLRKKFSDAEFNNHLLAYYALMLEALRQAKDFERGRKLLPEMRAWVVTCKHLIDKQNLSVLYLAAGNICFTLGEYKAAGKWAQEIINDADIKGYRDDVQCYARIINVIAHYKMENHKRLPKLIRSTFRFLLKKKKLYRVELCIMSFLRNKLPKKNTKKALLLTFIELKKELDKILEDKNERKMLALFDIRGWLESEISGKPMG